MSLFTKNEIAILSDKAGVDLPMRAGSRVLVLGKSDFKNFDYEVEFDDHTTSPVKNSELIKLTDEDRKWMDFIFIGNNVKSKLSNEIIHIEKVDYINKKVEIRFGDASCIVTDFNDLEPLQINNVEDNKLGYFEEKGYSLGKLVDSKQEAYGDSISKTSKLMKIFLEDYKCNNGYLIPEELLDHILLQVRIIDKQNRIFSNPKADKMNESPYDDITGYGMLGGRMQNV